MGGATIPIRWHLEVVGDGSSRLLREDRKIRSSLQATDRIQRRLATAASRSANEQARGAARASSAASRSARATRQQGTAATRTARDVKLLNAAQAQALGAGSRIASQAHRIESAYRGQARAARELSTSERARAREERASSTGRAAAAGGLGAAARGGASRLVGAAAGVGLAGAAVSAFAGFEQQMSRVQAVSGGTTRQLAQMTAQAKKLGADTSFSAKQAAGGMYELATAGFRADDVMRAIPGTLNLAAASGTDLADAAEIQAAALRGFGLDAKDAGRVADALTATVNASAVEMYDLGDSLKYIAPVAHATGQSMESMLAAVGLMGNVGIKGSQAGTTLRTALVRLTAPTKKSSAALEDLGIKAEDLRGPKGLLPLPEIMEKIAEGSSHVDKGTRNAALAAIFGREALSGMVAMVDKGPAALKRQIKALQQSEGQAKRTAHIMRTNVAGAWDTFTGSLETAAITVTQKASPAIQKGLRGAASAVNDLATGLTGGAGRGSAAEDLGHTLRGAAGAAVDFVRGLAPAKSFVANVLVPIGRGVGDVLLTGLKLAALAATGLAHALGLIGAVAKDHPALLRAIGVGMAIVAVRSRFLAAGGLVGMLGKATGLLGRMRDGWLGVATAERVAAREGTRAATAGALGAGGARGGGIRNLIGQYGIARAYGGSGLTGRAGGMGRVAALGATLGPVAMGALRAIGPAALGVSLISGLMSGIESKRSDFGGKLQDFLHGATLGAVHSAGRDFGDRVEKTYRTELDAALGRAARGAQSGAGISAVTDVLNRRTATVTRPGALFRRTDVDTSSVRQQLRDVRNLTNERARLQRQLSDVRAHPGKDPQLGRQADLSGDLRNVNERLKQATKNAEPFLRQVPKIAGAFRGRGDYRSLQELQRELRGVAGTGRTANAAIAAVNRQTRLARGATFQAQTRNLGRGAARNLGEVSRTVAQANASMRIRGLKPGDADFARAQEALAKAATTNIRKLVRQHVITAEQGRARIRQIWKAAQQDAGRSFSEAGKAGVRGLDQMTVGWVRGWARAGKITDRSIGRIGNSLKRLPSGARQASAQAMVLMARQMEAKGQLVHGSADRLVFLLQSRFGDLGNIDEPVKSPLQRIAQLLDGLRGHAGGAAGALGSLGSALGSLFPKGFLSTLASAVSQLGGLSGILPSLGALGDVAGALLKKRRGGRIGRFAGGGRVPILAAGGELYVEGGRASVVPGDPASDSTLILAKPGAGVLTGDGQARMMGGESYASALAGQLPHYRAGGRVTPGRYIATSYGPPWGGIQGGGVTATGVNLRGSPHLYGVAVDPRLIALGASPYIWPNPFGYSGRFRAFDTGGAIKGNRIDFYDWRGRPAQTGWGHRGVNVSAGPLHGGGNTYTEDGGAGRQPELKVLGPSKTRGNLTDDPFAAGVEAGTSGLTREWVRRGGSPIIQAIREQAESTPTTGGGSLAERKRSSSGKGGAKFKPGGGYAGTENLVKQAIRGFHASSFKRSHAVNGNQNSDHNTWIKNAYAADVPATGKRGDQIFSTIRGRLGIAARKGSWNRFDNKPLRGFRSQLLWYAPDGTHRDHVHTGIRRMRRGGLVGYQGGGTISRTRTGHIRAGAAPPALALETGALERLVRRALTFAGGTLEALDAAVGRSTENALYRIRASLRARIRRGGPEKVVKRLQAALDVVDYELGRRIGEQLDRVAQRTTSLERVRGQASRDLRRRGIDEGSSAGVTALQGVEQQAGSVLQKNVIDLQQALAQAKRHGNREQIRELTSQLDTARDDLDESFVRQVELRREAIRAWAQEQVDTAQHRLDLATGAGAALEAGQRLANLRGSAAARGLGIEEFTSGIAAADTPEGMRQRAGQITSVLIPALRGTGAALEQQRAAALATGDLAGYRAAEQAIQQNATDLATALGDAGELLRDAALKAATDVVDATAHGTNLAQAGLQHLELEQRVAGTYDAGGAQRAAFIESQVIPSLRAELAALREEERVQREQGASISDLNATIEAEAAKTNEILQAQLDEQEQIAENTEPRKFGGSLGFAFGSETLTDSLVTVGNGA